MKRLIDRGRRRLLLLLLGLGASAAGIALAGTSRSTVTPTVATTLAALVARDSAVAIGSEYLKLPGSESRPEAIVHALPRDLTLAVRPNDTSDLGRIFSQCCREDFAAGRTMEINGWVLSQTEVRVCALSCMM